MIEEKSALLPLGADPEALKTSQRSEGCKRTTHSVISASPPPTGAERAAGAEVEVEGADGLGPGRELGSAMRALMLDAAQSSSVGAGSCLRASAIQRCVTHIQKR